MKTSLKIMLFLLALIVVLMFAFLEYIDGKGEENVAEQNPVRRQPARVKNIMELRDRLDAEHRPQTKRKKRPIKIMGTNSMDKLN